MKTEMNKPPSNDVESSALVSWPPLDEIDGETQQLVYLVEAAWSWQWPGWEWVATSLNKEYGNKRTAQACRAKYGRINAWIMATRKPDQQGNIIKKQLT